MNLQPTHVHKCIQCKLLTQLSISFVGNTATCRVHLTTSLIEKFNSLNANANIINIIPQITKINTCSVCVWVLGWCTCACIVYENLIFTGKTTTPGNQKQMECVCFCEFG